MRRWPWSRVDLGGRPALVYKDLVKVRLVGDLQTELVEDFFGGFVNHAGANLHAKVLYGRSNHHKIEAIFKCFARAHEVRLLEGRAAEGPVAVHQGPAMIAIFDYGAGNLRSRAEYARRDRREYDTGARRRRAASAHRRSFSRASATSAR